MKTTTIGTIGILSSSTPGSPPFSGEGYARRLALAGRKYGIQVVVFCPDGVPEGQENIQGYIFSNGAWHAATVPFPDIVYDRCFPQRGSEYRAAARLLADAPSGKRWILWSRGLPGKGQVDQVLRKEPGLLPFLPPTAVYRGSSQLLRSLEKYDGELFMKPMSGSQGKNTLRVTRHAADGSLTIRGRSASNLPFVKRFDDTRCGLAWIRRFTGERSYLIQPFLHLFSADGAPFDVRVLMQKNETGSWMHTGMALRLGNPDSITSNLHGGGKPLSVLPFLTEQFRADRAEHIRDRLHNLSEKIPPILESRYGRLGELGIDFGIDTKGRIWLLEVNSKPGRTSFRHIGEPGSDVLATENPLRYARYLLLRQLRRVN